MRWRRSGVHLESGGADQDQTSAGQPGIAEKPTLQRTMGLCARHCPRGRIPRSVPRLRCDAPSWFSGFRVLFRRVRVLCYGSAELSRRWCDAGYPVGEALRRRHWWHCGMALLIPVWRGQVSHARRWRRWFKTVQKHAWLLPEKLPRRRAGALHARPRPDACARIPSERRHILRSLLLPGPVHQP